MLGLMQDHPLLISNIFEHAINSYSDQLIISNTVEGGIHKYSYKDWGNRTKKLANALKSFGLSKGDKVGTLAWNGYRHLEIYYATSSSEFICHTINPRLHPDQISYIVNHAEDKVLIIDPTFIPLVEGVQDQLNFLETIIIAAEKSAIPENNLNNACSYDDLLAQESSEYQWPELSEDTSSALCYTSGTTGNPKGVLYSHRSTILHAISIAGTMGFHSSSAVLPVVPMFHVNAWGVPYSALINVCFTLVFPGTKLDGKNLANLMNDEAVTVSLGVPTIWLALLNHLRQSGETLKTVKRLIIGGSACPRVLFEGFGEEFGIDVIHAWGMTEMSPLGTVNTALKVVNKNNKTSYYDQKMPQGRTIFGHQMKLVDDDGNGSPDIIHVHGWIAALMPLYIKEYYKDDTEKNKFLDDGWFETGDVATIDNMAMSLSPTE